MGLAVVAVAIFPCAAGLCLSMLLVCCTCSRRRILFHALISRWAVGSVGNDKGAVNCFLFIPHSVAWAAGLSKWGYPHPLNPGRTPERAGRSTQTPLISPEKLALPRPARGATLA